MSIALLAAVTMLSSTGSGARQAMLRGKVIDSISGESLESARVVVSPTTLESLSSHDGNFTIGPLGPGRYEIQIQAHGYRARAFVFEIDSLLLYDHELGKIPLAPADSLTFDIVGLVRDVESREAVVGATVAVNDRLLDVTIFDGSFAGQLRLPAGLNVVRVRASGFETTTAEIWLELIQTPVTLDIALTHAPFRLPDVTVVAEAVDDKLEQFHTHRRSELGSFLHGEALESARRRTVTDILRGVPGVQVLPGTNTVRLSRAPRVPLCNREQPQFFVDGLAIRLHIGETINGLVEQDDIIGVEVYNGGVTIPLTYKRGNSTCGVIVIWTR